MRHRVGGGRTYQEPGFTRPPRSVTARVSPAPPSRLPRGDRLPISSSRTTRTAAFPPDIIDDRTPPAASAFPGIERLRRRAPKRPAGTLRGTFLKMVTASAVICRPRGMSAAATSVGSAPWRFTAGHGDAGGTIRRTKPDTAVARTGGDDRRQPFDPICIPFWWLSIVVVVQARLPPLHGIDAAADALPSPRRHASQPGSPTLLQLPAFRPHAAKPALRSFRPMPSHHRRCRPSPPSVLSPLELPPDRTAPPSSLFRPTSPALRFGKSAGAGGRRAELSSRPS